VEHGDNLSVIIVEVKQNHPEMLNELLIFIIILAEGKEGEEIIFWIVRGNCFCVEPD